MKKGNLEKVGGYPGGAQQGRLAANLSISCRQQREPLVVAERNTVQSRNTSHSRRTRALLGKPESMCGVGLVTIAE